MPRTDHARAAAILWGGWLIVTGAVLSFASGIIHTYYTVELAPAIAALVGIGTVLLWRARARLGARFALAAGAVVTALWSVRPAAPHADVRPVGRLAGTLRRAAVAPCWC